jgi:hypothetical protein
MENHINQSPAIPKWSALLIEAVTKPGLIMKAYTKSLGIPMARNLNRRNSKTASGNRRVC